MLPESEPGSHPFCMRRGAEVPTDQGPRLSEALAEFERDPGWTEVLCCKSSVFYGHRRFLSHPCSIKRLARLPHGKGNAQQFACYDHQRGDRAASGLIREPGVRFNARLRYACVPCHEVSKGQPERGGRPRPRPRPRRVGNGSGTGIRKRSFSGSEHNAPSLQLALRVRYFASQRNCDPRLTNNASAQPTLAVLGGAYIFTRFLLTQLHGQTRR